MQDYNAAFVTRAGKKNLAVDAMSRLGQEREADAKEISAEEESGFNEEAIFTTMEALDKKIEWEYGPPSLGQMKEEQRKDRDPADCQIHAQGDDAKGRVYPASNSAKRARIHHRQQ